GIIPEHGVADAKLRAGGHETAQGGSLVAWNFPDERECAVRQFDLIANTELGLELKPFGNRHAFGANVAVAPAALAVDAAVGPYEFESRRYFRGLHSHD